MGLQFVRMNLTKGVLLEKTFSWTAVTLVVVLGVVASGCVATRADDVYRQRQEEARKRAIQQKPLPEATNAGGVDEYVVRRGKALFNGKAVCWGCHGPNGDLNQVNNPRVAKLSPRPTDLREPSDKSVRQLYLIIKYGISGTGMVPVEEEIGLGEEDMFGLVSYVLSIQGKPLALSEIIDQVHDRDGPADRAIAATCAEKEIYSKAQEMCEHRIRQRYRELLIGRPPDIPSSRYSEIQTDCTQQFGTDLEGLAQCYRLQYRVTRQQMR